MTARNAVRTGESLLFDRVLNRRIMILWSYRKPRGDILSTSDSLTEMTSLDSDTLLVPSLDKGSTDDKQIKSD